MKKKSLHNKLYTMMIEIIFIFGIPALLAFFTGKYIDESLLTGKTWTIVLLVVAFFASWTVLIARVKRIGREIKEVESRIKAERQAPTPIDEPIKELHE